MLMGALAGLLVVNPLSGMVDGLAGAGFGTLSGALRNYGINDDLIAGLPKGTLALFLLMGRSSRNKVLPQIPRVIKTPLTRKQEEKLKAALSGVVTAA